MANQKAELHNIPLKTMDVCLNKYDHDIKPYSGFRKNNSPFYGNLLSPFYSRRFRSLGDNSFISPQGGLYSLVDGKLVYTDNEGNDVYLSDTSSKYAYRDVVLPSNSNTYQYILGFFKEATGYSILAATGEGKLAILNSNMTIKYDLSDDSRFFYLANEKVHFTECDNGKYMFAIANTFYYVYDDGNTVTKSCYGSTRGTSTYSGSCCKVIYNSIYTYYFIFIFNHLSNLSDIYCVMPSGGTGNVFTLRVYKNGNMIVDNYSQSGLPVFANNKGKAIFFNKDIHETVDSNTRIYLHGMSLRATAGSPDGVGLGVDIDPDSYSSVSTSQFSDYTITPLSKVLDNNTCIAVFGNKTPAYTVTTSEQGHYETRDVYGWVYMKTYDYTDGNGIPHYSEKPVWKKTGTEQVWVVDVPATSVNHASTYVTLMVDTNNNTTVYRLLPLDSNGNFPGGLYSNINDNVRLLYHGGVMQAVSISSNPSNIGTLLCGMQEIDYDYPICCWTDTDTNDIYLFYHDTKTWQKVIVTEDTTKASISVLNNRYILVNSIDYLNCFDTQGYSWYHFASDWNDRAIVKCTYSGAVPTDFNDYKSNTCELWYFASAQGANYEKLNIPFVSSRFAAYAAYFPKTASNIEVALLAGSTPNNQDVDIYFSKNIQSANAPLYQYTVDKKDTLMIKYIDEKLRDSKYNYSFMLIPSIFAKFIQGFINKGIIIDNNHSYLQVFENTTKPVFAINFSSQLEGVTAAFVVQGRPFVVIEDAIYYYDPAYTEAPSAIVKIDNMELVGYTPYMAIFWSFANKTFYRFTGDNILEPLVQADELDGIVMSSFNPNTLSIYVITNKNVLIFNQEHLVKLELTGYTKCFPLYNGCALSGTNDTLLLSYNKAENYEVEPIELETECYGLGNSIKSVNDCVYIRLFDPDRKAGKVVVKCETLNEISVESNSKEFNITTDMWDKNSNTIFLRYQPKYQAATGFSVKVKSPFAIATLQISATPETVQNSKYNV